MIYFIARTTQIMESWWLKVWSNADVEEEGLSNNYTSIREISPFLISHITVNTTISGLIPSTYYSLNQQFGRILSPRIFLLNNDENETHSVDYYLNIYVIITLVSSLFGVVRYTILYYGGLRASKKLYEVLLHQVLRAPLRFFDTTPVGRILNRFSKDFETIDSKLSGINLDFFF
jgi:ABC-type multidrug transport system fused ATPase/permease subunit